MAKKLTDIAKIASDSNPWTQDPSDARFFFIRLKKPWKSKNQYLEKNKSGQSQALVFDPDFVGKRQRKELIQEDAIGVSADGLTLWRFSADNAPTLSISDIGYGGDWIGWQAANGWTNGSPFAVGWTSESVMMDDKEVVTLRISDKPASGTPYSAGEFRTDQKYGYGRYEVAMKASNVPGTMTGFFSYTGAAEGDQHDEIDVEFAGSDPRQLRLTYWTNGVPVSSYLNLSFDASTDFHVYAFDWKPDRIDWYVDGALFHSEIGSRGALPTNPGKIMINFWAGDASAESWLGAFKYTKPIFAYFKNPELSPA